MSRPLPRLAALLAFLAGPLSAQEGGTVSGVARDPDGRPIAGAFILALRNPDAVLEPVAGVLTDSVGRYVLRGLPSEPLVLRVRRLGWTLSDPTAVTPTGGITSLDLTVESRALDLTPVRVMAAGACVGRDGLANAPEIAAVWSAAIDAVRMNQALATTYAISTIAERTTRNGDAAPTVAIDTILPEVPSADAKRPTPDDELFGTARRAGLRQRLNVMLQVRGPGVLAEEAFLRGYCVGNAVETADDGLVALTFAPQRPNARRVEARGKILFDPTSARFVGAEYDFLHDGKRVGRTAMRVAYVDVDGATVPMFDRNHIEFLHLESGEPYFAETIVYRERRFSPWPASLRR